MANRHDQLSAMSCRSGTAALMIAPTTTVQWPKQPANGHDDEGRNPTRCRIDISTVIDCHSSCPAPHCRKAKTDR
jgi:hypothetical protein